VHVPDPVAVDVLEGIEKAGDRELGNPDGVDDGDVRGLPLGDRVSEHVVEGRKRHGDGVHLDPARRRVANHLAPDALRDHDAHLRLVGPAPQPVGVHEGPPAAVAEDHPLLGELGERAAHRRATDPVVVTELVLGREPVAGSVAAFEDLLQQQRLQLEVERDRLRGVDCHVSSSAQGALAATDYLSFIRYKYH
jgi:hypothetical protein